MISIHEVYSSTAFYLFDFFQVKIQIIINLTHLTNVRFEEIDSCKSYFFKNLLKCYKCEYLIAPANLFYDLIISRWIEYKLIIEWENSIWYK